MKNKILLLAMAAVILCSFKVAYDATHSTADVNQYEGVYVFIDSKPAQPYDFLGKVHINSTGGMSYNAYPDQRKKLIKKAAKDYPGTQGIVITIADNGSADADCIKFK